MEIKNLKRGLQGYKRGSWQTLVEKLRKHFGLVKRRKRQMPLNEFETQLIEKLKKDYPFSGDVKFMRYSPVGTTSGYVIMDMPIDGKRSFPLIDHSRGLNDVCAFLKMDIVNHMLKISNRLLDVVSNL